MDNVKCLVARMWFQCLEGGTSRDGWSKGGEGAADGSMEVRRPRLFRFRSGPNATKASRKPAVLQARAYKGDGMVMTFMIIIGAHHHPDYDDSDYSR